MKAFGFVADTVHKEVATITAVFHSPNEVMSILVQVPKDMIFISYGFKRGVAFPLPWFILI